MRRETWNVKRRAMVAVSRSALYVLRSTLNGQRSSGC
jgi:hypothetical protein